MISRTQKAKWNITSSIIAQIVCIVCGLIVPQLMIRSFGSEMYGATTSITHFLAYIALVESGVAGVARAALYKPLAEGDAEVTSEIYYEISGFFRKIGVIFVAYSLVIACCYRYIAGNSELDWFFSFVLVIVISISTIGQYLLGISNSILIQSDQRHYIVNILSILTVSVNNLFIVVLIYLGCNLIIVKLATSLIYLMRQALFAVYVKRHYKILPSAKRVKSNRLSQKWTALGQHLAYFLHSNTDVVVLTVLTDLKTVAVYSIYYMIVEGIRNLTACFYNGLESVFGNMYAKRELDKLDKVFGHYETLISIVGITLYSATAVLIVPFVKLYTIEVADANYIMPEFAILAVLAEMVYTLRTPYQYLANAANRFKQTRMAAYGEAVINIVLSLALVLKFGIVGVASATLAAIAFRSLYYAVYMSRHIIHRNILLYVKRNILNGMTFVTAVAVGVRLVRMVGTENYFKWFLCGSIVFVTALTITAAVNIIFYREDVRAILSRTLVGKTFLKNRL